MTIGEIMKQWDIIYEYCSDPVCMTPTSSQCEIHGFYRVVPPNPDTVPEKLQAKYTFNLRGFLGLMLLAIGMGGIFGPFVPALRLEASYAFSNVASRKPDTERELPKSMPVVFEPLKTPDGTVITPADNEFGLIVPKIGINSRVIPGVDPTKLSGYEAALKAGVAHANTSFMPDEDGTVYLFSHSTNYDWFVKDLNAIFYLVKNLEKEDKIVLMYKGKRYTYKITEKRVVSPRSISYIIPYAGKKNLILQTCWPPGSTTERLLIFADLIEENGKVI